MLKKRDAEYYEVDQITGCWNWLYSLFPSGYAVLWRNGRTGRASRYFYEKYIGIIPKGLVIDHLCRNRKCVNPMHLEATTQKENVRRGDRVKLSVQKVEKIKQEYEKGVSQNKLASMFNINQSNISRAINNLRWV